VVEIGGESTRPGAQPVSVDDEIARVVPVIEATHATWPEARIAIDTVKSIVARAAIAAGASVVNDVAALRLDPEIARVCADTGATLVLMHSRGTVADMARYHHADYAPRGVMDAIVAELSGAATRALDAGVSREHIVLDPGLGFSKRGEHSIEALAHLPRLVEFGFPVMVGASRKRFLGEITGVQQASERDAATLGAHVVALTLGASWFRVHDVRSHRHALDVAAAILEARG
jgi:dihydropteroate synthase